MLFGKYRQLVSNIWWNQKWYTKPFLFLRMLQWQKEDKKIHPQYYRPHGIIVFDGLYGSGKTTSLIWYAKIITEENPKMKVFANFDCQFSDGIIQHIEDIETITDDEGVIFLIDEAQKSFGARQWKDFPIETAAQLAENRKMAKLFLIATQNFVSVDVQIRRLTLYIVECRSFMGLWFRNRFYTPDDFEKRMNPLETRPKAIKKYSFVGFPELFASFASLSRVSKLTKK